MTKTVNYSQNIRSFVNKKNNSNIVVNLTRLLIVIVSNVFVQEVIHLRFVRCVTYFVAIHTTFFSNSATWDFDHYYEQCQIQLAGSSYHLPAFLEAESFE